jgi:hypothetical protein
MTIMSCGTRGAVAPNAASLLRVLVACVCVTSCTVVLKTDKEQCSNDQDCAARGPELAGTVCRENVCAPAPDTSWSCVGSVREPAEGTTYKAAIRVIDLISGKPPKDGTVKLCNKYDPPCAGPLLDVPMPPDGLVSSDVPSTFRGFFSIVTTTVRPTLYFVDTGGPAITNTVALLTPAASAALNSALKPTPSPDSGSVSITMTDCNGKRAAGVHFDIDVQDGVLPFYVLGSAISPTATATDVGGNGGFANLKEGTVTITAKLEKTGQVVGTVSTLIRPKSVTYQPLRPTP